MKNKNSAIYDTYLDDLEKLLKECKQQENAAYFLYLNKARTLLFMLESITRILYKSTGDKFAKPWYKLFKKLEDMLGKIDELDVFVRDFKTNRRVKGEELHYLTKKLEKAVEEFNSKLKKEHFFLHALEKFRSDADTNFNDKGLLITFHEHIKTEILLAEEFFSRYHNGFSNFEDQVHTLRRKLRWISIYGISLGGIVILKDTHKKYKWEKEFVTKRDRDSEYNKLPVKKGLPYYIPLNKKAFYALSHVVANLGVIKDKGLAIGALEKALKKTGALKQRNPRIEAKRQLQLKETEQHLLKDAYDLMYRFFVDNKIHIELFTV
ncbi:MAG: hypothetical protein ACXVC7_03980 [Bacteroidia bacterium]